MGRLGPALVVISLALPAAASAHSPAKQYVLKHAKREHCKAHYVKKAATVKKREHGRTVKVRETLCVYVAPKRKAATTPAPASPSTTAPARTVKLHAHLDPTFTRDPADPFKVMYAFSASATSEAVGIAAQAAPLPEGVLALYSDGSLACAINVGGETTGGECPVTYTALGAQTVTTIYSSGSTSATETSTEIIEPIGTTTTVAASYEALAAPDELHHETRNPCEREERGGLCEEGVWWIGTLTVTGTASTAFGTTLTPSLSANGLSSPGGVFRIYLEELRWVDKAGDTLNLQFWSVHVVEEHSESSEPPKELAPAATEVECKATAHGFAGDGYTPSEASKMVSFSLPSVSLSG